MDVADFAAIKPVLLGFCGVLLEVTLGAGKMSLY